MKKKFQRYFIIFSILIFFIACSSTEDFKILHQVTGGIQTNCFLIYGVKSKEAALVDIGGSINTLVSHIITNNLKLKYLFVHTAILIIL